MNFTRTQIESDLQCKMELLGRLEAKGGYLGTDPHKHPFFEVFYVFKGSFEVSFEKDTQSLSRGDIFVITPNVIHQFTSADGGEMLYVGISLTYGTNEQYDSYLRLISADLSETMERVSYLAASKGASALHSAVGELMPKLAGMIISVTPQKAASEADTLSENIKSYLRRHYNENVTVRDIAAALYMNSHYLGEYFKRNNGISVKDYLLNLRMQRAFSLLREGNMTVSQVSESVGFDTVQYFSTKFKAYYGFSPAKYMEKLKGNNE